MLSKTFTSRCTVITLSAVLATLYVLYLHGGPYLSLQDDNEYRPKTDGADIWSGATQGVVDCRSGRVVRKLKDTRSWEELHRGIHVNQVTGAVSETDDERKQSFVGIFNKKTWKGQAAAPNASDAIIGSGPGSTLKNAVNVKRTLNSIINMIKKMTGKKIIKVLDIPCGDLTWMSQFMANRSDVIYRGMDIVPDIIAHHTRVYTPKYPHMTFINQDIVQRPLGEAYDLIHTRAMTQHLTNADTLRVLHHFKDSGSLFLMATTVPSAGGEELDVKKRGRHRLQNLEAAPIGLPPPVCISQDVSVERNGLWVLNL